MHANKILKSNEQSCSALNFQRARQIELMIYQNSPKY